MRNDTGGKILTVFYAGAELRQKIVHAAKKADLPISKFLERLVGRELRNVDAPSETPLKTVQIASRPRRDPIEHRTVHVDHYVKPAYDRVESRPATPFIRRPRSDGFTVRQVNNDTAVEKARLRSMLHEAVVNTGGEPVQS